MCTIIRRRRLGMSSVKGIAAFSKTDIQWVRSDRLPLPLDNLYIRWGCTADVPSQKVLNTAKGIHEVNDKAAFRMRLSENLLAPQSVINSDLVNDLPMPKGMNYPVVVRPNKHAQGRNLFLCQTYDEALVAIDKCGIDGYTSEYIDKVKEYRVAVVQGRAVWVVEKTPGNPDDVGWNVAKGGRFDNVKWNDWPLKVVKTAIEAFNLSSLDFGGVDVMVDEDNNAYVLEINSAPSLTSPYRQECFAKAFDWIVERGKERISLVDRLGGYTKFIHPAIEPKAKLVEAVE